MMYFIEIKPYDRIKFTDLPCCKAYTATGFRVMPHRNRLYGLRYKRSVALRLPDWQGFGFRFPRTTVWPSLLALRSYLGKATHSQKITVVHRAGHRAARRAWSLVWRAAVGLLDGRYGFFIGGSRWEFECRQRIKIVIYFSPTVRSLAPPTRSQPKRK